MRPNLITKNIAQLGWILVFCFLNDRASAQQEQGASEIPAKDETPSWARPATDPALEQADDFSLAEESEQLRVESSTGVRRFHEVLDDLLMEFGYDIEQGQLGSLKSLSIRQVSLNENLPRSYENYLELLVSERIRENSQVKLIACLSCKTRSSTLVDGKLVITSPKTNVQRLNSAAEQLGVQHFMDVTLVYHSTHMVLAFQIFAANSKELVWARAYNSETIRSKFQKLAVDYNQVAKARKSEEYEPEYKFLLGFVAAGIPNIAGTSEDSSMLGLQMRAMERFDRRKHEFGLMLNFLLTSSSLKPQPSAEASAEPSAEETAEPVEAVKTIKPYKSALSLFAIYSYNFLGLVESYNEIRHGLHAGLGPLLASAYFAPMGRVGWDVYFGRRWVVTTGIMYVGASSTVVGSDIVKTKGGLGGDLVVSFNF
jgi:hypothetical protein